MTPTTTQTHAIALESRAGGKAIFVTVTGELTAPDYEYFVPYVDKQIAEQGKVDMLVDLQDFHGWTAGAMWQDTKFAGRHFSDIGRLALVGDRRWEKGLAVFCKPFTRAEVRYFDRSKRDDAEAWALREEDE